MSSSSAVKLHLEQPALLVSPAADRNVSSRLNKNSLHLNISGNQERSPLLHAALTHVEIDRPGTPSIRQRDYLSHPITSNELDFETELPPTPGGSPSFFSQARGGPLPAPTYRSRVRLLLTQTWTNILSAFFLVVIVIWALSSRFWASLPDYVLPWRWKNLQDYKRHWDQPDKWASEKLVKDPSHYAENCGYRIVHQTVETEDGYYLKVHKVEVPGRNNLKADGKGGYPVIIQHGLFQTSGSFVTSEERSLAFWLAEHGGYQVYLSNNRAVFDMGHRALKRSDPRFWDYNIRELALYDLPAVIEHVKRETGYNKVAFIGHSQGNATMFCTLARGMKPDVGKSLSIFIALAPAVYAGPLTTGFPFNLIKSMDWHTWKRLFGVLDFIPVLKRRKPKMFRFTPSPVSSASIFWWTGLNGFSARGCVLDDKVHTWYDKRFPPLSLYYGGRDYLVLVEPLLERIKNNEKDVNLVRVDKLDTGEHCDTFWHLDAVELCYRKLLEDIETTRERFPGEQPISNGYQQR